MTARTSIRGAGLKKVFNRRIIFENVFFALEGARTMLISGRNGSGKSTLVKIVAGLLAPTKGTVSIDGTGARNEFDRRAAIGMVSPYLQMYDEFSAAENLQFAMAIRGMRFDREFAHDLLKRVAIFQRKDDPVRTYSSGMKQRVKYAFALIHRPPVLILDEPMSNLDAEGISIVRTIMAEHRNGGILIVATNDLSDVEGYDEHVDLNVGR
jgi:heme exporter protein A